MLENRKHVFWEALLIAILIFSIGLVFGVYLEQLRSSDSNSLFYQSEISLYDSLTLGRVMDNPSVSCDDLKKANINFADKVYSEAKLLGKFDGANKITQDIKLIHRKYDLLRTLQWIDLINLKKKCGDINTVVYLYVYESNNIEQKAKQSVWSKVLQDLKQNQGDKIILLPIAADQNVTSLDYLISQYNITEFPAVVINEKMVVYNQTSFEELRRYLK